jgi:hypothetical protein
VTDQTADQSNADDEFIWLVGPISEFLGRTERATYHLLENDKVPGAKRVGGRWCLMPSVFRKSFEQGVAA